MMECCLVGYFCKEIGNKENTEVWKKLEIAREGLEVIHVFESLG